MVAWACHERVAPRGRCWGTTVVKMGYVATMPYPACLRRRANFVPVTQAAVNMFVIAVGALLVAALWVLLCKLGQKVLCWLR